MKTTAFVCLFFISLVVGSLLALTCYIGAEAKLSVPGYTLVATAGFLLGLLITTVALAEHSMK